MTIKPMVGMIDSISSDAPLAETVGLCWHRWHLAIGSSNGVFGLFTIWLPEMFPSTLRGAGSGFAFSMGRILGAAGPTLIGALAAATGSYPLAISLLSVIYIVGLPFIAMAPETANRPLAK
jgi:cyanate permease